MEQGHTEITKYGLKNKFFFPIHTLKNIIFLGLILNNGKKLQNMCCHTSYYMFFCSGGGHYCVVIVQAPEGTFIMFWIFKSHVVRSNFDEKFMNTHVHMYV